MPKVVHDAEASNEPAGRSLLDESARCFLATRDGLAVRWGRSALARVCCQERASRGPVPCPRRFPLECGCRGSG